MKATVDETLCMGCKLCTEICPDVFAMKGDLATVIADPATPKAEAECRDAMEQCPVLAITLS